MAVKRYLLIVELWVSLTIVQVAVVQSLNRVRLSVTTWTAAHQAALSFIVSRSLLKLMSIESVMPSSHLILCRPLLLLPSIFPSIMVFSNKSALCVLAFSSQSTVQFKYLFIMFIGRVWMLFPELPVHILWSFFFYIVIFISLLFCFNNCGNTWNRIDIDPFYNQSALFFQNLSILILLMYLIDISLF